MDIKLAKTTLEVLVTGVETHTYSIKEAKEFLQYALGIWDNHNSTRVWSDAVHERSSQIKDLERDLRGINSRQDLVAYTQEDSKRKWW